MEKSLYVTVGDLVKVTNTAVGIVVSIDTEQSKPIGVLFFTGEIMLYAADSVDVISSYHVHNSTREKELHLSQHKMLS